MHPTPFAIEGLGTCQLDPDSLSVLLVSDDACDGGRFQEQLTHSMDGRHELRVVPTLANAVQSAILLRPDVVIVDARGGQVPLQHFGEHVGYRAALILVVDDPLMGQRGFEAGAIDCLLVPFEAARLDRALQRAMTWVGHSVRQHEAEPGVPALPTNRRWLRMIRNGEIVVAKVEDIRYLRAERKFTRVVMTGLDGFLRDGIGAVAAQLDPQQFWQIHRSIVVNANYIRAINQDELGRVSVRLRDSVECLFASRQYKKTLLRDGIC